jgi:hypothetical protein
LPIPSWTWATPFVNIRSRFADREDLGKTRVRQQYWPELPEQDVMELFDVIQLNFQLLPGLLRPDDLVDKLAAPVKTANPLKWLVCRARTEDSLSELDYHLGKRLRQHGTQKAWEHTKIVTVNDLARAWCGKLPLSTSPGSVDS